MRIVGDIAHPRLKISIFHHAERYAVKFEHAGIEITFKFSAEEGATDLASIKAMMDNAFIAAAEEKLRALIPMRLEKIAEVLPAAREGEFDEII
ncbi:MAG: hypothetical protein KDC24_02150 [Saprospiraceae bacterium]|nr:hypothetical protein [Saprospiraceae bacterium]